MILRIVDLETSGLVRAEGAEIVELAFEDHSEEGFALLNKFQTLVKPERGMTCEARAVNHISDKDLAVARSWNEVLQELQQFPQPNILISHKSAFEKQFL